MSAVLARVSVSGILYGGGRAAPPSAPPSQVFVKGGPHAELVHMGGQVGPALLSMGGPGGGQLCDVTSKKKVTGMAKAPNFQEKTLF